LFEQNLTDLNINYCIVNLERIEACEGPQGTLFGSGAQAGVLRYTLNTPTLNVTARARVFALLGALAPLGQRPPTPANP